MPNKSGNAYGLTTLCPIINGSENNRSYGSIIQQRLQALPLHEESPMAQVPNTYLCRFFVLDDVRFQGKPARLDHLKSKYLVFTSNFYGDLETYLRGMWKHAESSVRKLFEHCVAFDGVSDATAFVRYIKRCQVKTTFFFNGSTDAPLADQLKSLYLKQELAKFATEHQGQSAPELQGAFLDFLKRTRPRDLEGPTWRPGASTLDVLPT